MICDDVSYFDEPMFQNGVVAQAIQTVEAEGVTYVAAAANNASNAYQAAWTHSSGTFNGFPFTDAESFGGSIVQTITVTASTTHPVPLLLEWDRAYGQANFSLSQNPDIDLWVFQNGTLLTQATNVTVGEANNPFTGVQFTASGTYQIVITNNFGADPTTIKEVLFGNGASVSISGANAGTVYGHSMTPGVITAGAVSVASTPAFGVSPAISETFSSSGAGTELLFANDGTRLSSPQLLSPVAVSGLDGIATTVPGGLSDFFGTSAASASLAGVAAIILAENPFLTPAQVEEIMEQTASPMANPAVSGAGLVNVNAAVAAAAALLPQPVAIEAFGFTELAQLVSDYFLNPISGGTGPELMYAGTPFVAGAWMPIGAEQTSTGYEVALFNASSVLYTVWNTDFAGNVLSASLSGVSGTSTALESIEVSFHQDLNGDGTIGVPTATGTTIEAFGATKLVQVGNDYFFNPVAGGTGPELTYGGTPWASGQAWTPIGAEKTSAGYEVALQNSSTHLFTIWNADSGGNVLSASLSNVSGASTALELIEVSFQQDLNGDHVIGVPSGPPPNSTTIESFGVTALVQTGNNYFFNPVAGGSGPELTYSGTPYVAAAWTPIGVEKTSTGYEVALLNSSTHLFTIWNTDSGGNVLSAPLANVSGTSTALESIEVSFQQDLNGDNTIGIPGQSGTAVASTGPAPAAFTASDAFAFRTDLGGKTAGSIATSTVPQQAGELIASAATHMGEEFQHMLTGVVQELMASHDGAPHLAFVDPAHGFIIH